MTAEGLDLTESAFNILNAGYDASRSDIAELVEDAEFNEIFEPQQIQRAQQSLLAPNTRLRQEISWLPEMSQVQIAKVLRLISSGDLHTLIKDFRHVPELAKANILAHFACSGNVNDTLFHDLVAAWDEIDQENIHNFINDSRLISGFPPVEIQQVQNALAELEKKHARSAAVGVWSLELPGEVMERIVEAQLERNPSSTFLEQFVRKYDLLSEPYLARISEKIDRVISKYENTDIVPEALVMIFIDLLGQWDVINQPVQIYEQHQGHEEARSKQIYEKLRSLSLEWANNRDEFAAARALSEALLQTFPELESVAENLREDIEKLESLHEQQKLIEKYKALIDACDAAKTKLPTPVSSVLQIFKDTLSRGGADPIAFNIVRDLALHINNDCDDPQIAFELLDGVLAIGGTQVPQEIRKTLEDERAVLHKNWKMIEITRNNGNNAAISKNLDDMLKYAKGSDRTELLELKAKIDQKKNEKIVWWVVIGVIILLFVIFGG